MKTIDTRIGLATALAVGLLLIAASGTAGERKGLEKGTRAPNFFINTYNPESCGAKRVFLDKLVGARAPDKKKLLVLSFFNIDCKPCRKELPFLQRLYDRYKGDGLGVVVVNCDFKKEKIDEVVKYVGKSGFTFPVLKDRFQALQRRYAIGSFPTMYILDDQGLIVDVRVGYNEEKMPFPLADVQKRLEVTVEPLGEESGTEKSSKAGAGKRKS